MRVALVHYWLVTMRGGEKVLEALLEMFPQADIFTHVYNPAAVSDKIRGHRVTTSFIQKLPFATKAYQKYLPLMPLALEQLDLRGYDLVISSESGPAKGVLTDTETMHFCYCHSPMRYLWDFYQDYLEQSGFFTRTAMRFFSHHLRMWDVLSAQRVDFFAANSSNVARRITKHYRRESTVIHPPVDVAAFAPTDAVYPEPEDFYLYAGQLTAYKKVDLAIQACNKMGKKLVIIGEGEEEKRLRSMAGPTITFLGWQDSSVLRDKLQRCRALIFPGEEDFGMVPVEAMAAGRPVIAFARGGALETVKDKESGILFPVQDVSSLCTSLQEFESGQYVFNPADLTEYAKRFSLNAFNSAFKDFLIGSMEQASRKGSRSAENILHNL